jgi:hypothetical protein
MINVDDNEDGDDGDDSASHLFPREKQAALADNFWDCTHRWSDRGIFARERPGNRKINI